MSGLPTAESARRIVEELVVVINTLAADNRAARLALERIAATGYAQNGHTAASTMAINALAKMER